MFLKFLRYHGQVTLCLLHLPWCCGTSDSKRFYLPPLAVPCLLYFQRSTDSILTKETSSVLLSAKSTEHSLITHIRLITQTTTTNRPLTSHQAPEATGHAETSSCCAKRAVVDRPRRRPWESCGVLIMPDWASCPGPRPLGWG